MKKLMIVAAFAAMALGGTGCGKVLQSFNVSIPSDNAIDVNFTLDQQYQLQLNGEIAIMQYGKVYFLPPAAGAGTKFGVTVLTSAFLKDSWVNYGPTKLLPNGDPMPSYVEDPLVKIDIPVAHNNYVTPYVYFGLKDLNQQTGHYYVGVALEINAIDARFPQGLSISQTFFNKYNEPIVGISAYGPKVIDGVLAAPGGLFVAANITHIINGKNYTENGLKIGFNDGGMSTSKLYMLNNNLKRAIASTPKTVMKTDSKVMKEIVDSHNAKMMDRFVNTDF